MENISAIPTIAIRRYANGSGKNMVSDLKVLNLLSVITIAGTILWIRSFVNLTKSAVLLSVLFYPSKTISLEISKSAANFEYLHKKNENMELGRFKARIESDNWETDIENQGKQDLLFQNIIIENDKIQGTLKMKEGFTGTQVDEKAFHIFKRGESFILKTDFFTGSMPEMEIRFVKNDLQVSDKKSAVEITIFNKESYN